MLIEFAVSNFRSIKEEARLSLVAGPDKKLEDSNVAAKEPAHGARPIRVLRSAAIYGANASGKTNLLRGLKVMRDIVLNSSANLEELPVTPFRFDPACQSEPSWFEVVCIVDNVRYQYGFSATRHEVIDEWLYAWPSGRMQVWFERTRGVTPGTSKWTLGGKLAGDRQVWRRATRSQALFLSTAVALNSEQLSSLYNAPGASEHSPTSGNRGGSYPIHTDRWHDKNRVRVPTFAGGVRYEKHTIVCLSSVRAPRPSLRICPNWWIGTS